MPEVRRYGGRKIATDPLRGGQRTASLTETAAGVGLERAKAQRSEALADVGALGARISLTEANALRQKEIKHANEVASMEADTGLGRWVNKRMYDPETGALTIKGKDANGLPEQVGAEFEQVAGEIERTLTTDEQRLAFQRSKAQHAESLDIQLRRHVFKEQQEYTANVVAATVDTNVESAIAKGPDSRGMHEDMKKATDAIRGAAKAQGWSPEVVQKKIAAVQSATYEGVINNLLAHNQTSQAKDLYAELQRAKKETGVALLSGDADTRVRKALEVGSVRAESQQEAARILATGKSQTEMLEMARAIADPDVQDATVVRIRQEHEIANARKREVHEQVMINAADIIDKTSRYEAIPPAMIADMDHQERASLKRYAESKQPGGVGDVETDLIAYYELKQEAVEHPEAFANYNLLKELGHLGKTEFKELTDLQHAVRQGTRGKADKLIEGIRTNTQIFTDSMTEAGIDAGSKPAANLRRVWERHVDDAQATAKAPLSGSEKQQLLDDLTQSVILKPGGWANIFPGGEPFYPVTKPIANVTIADIPPADRTLIEQRLRDKKRPVTEDSILTTYINWKRALGDVKK